MAISLASFLTSARADGAEPLIQTLLLGCILKAKKHDEPLFDYVFLLQFIIFDEV